jgi:hypothetical protein
VAYNIQTRNNKIKLLTEYEGVTQKVLFGNAVLAALMCGRKYDVITQNVGADENYLRRWIFSDEATFYVSGRVNRYNCRI